MSFVHLENNGLVIEADTAPTAAVTTHVTTESKLLLLGEGTDGSTTIVDSSSVPSTITRVGNPVISTASFPTGMSSSISCISANSYLSIPWDASKFAVAAGADFTLEFYFNWTAHGNFGAIINNAFYTGSTFLGFQLLFQSTNNTIRLEIGTGSGFGTSATTSVAVSANTWTHIALTRTLNSVRLFINGTNRIGTLTNSVAHASLNPFYVNAERTGGTNGTTAYYSNVRFFNNVSLYSANFTPPALPLSASSTATTTNLVTKYGVIQNY